MTDLIGYVIWGEENAKQWYNGHMNSKDAAEYLGLSRYMLRKLVTENKIPYSRTFRDVSFHQTILDAWMRGEFIPGKVALILDEEVIDFDHGDALKEQYKRYPELLEQLKEQEIQLQEQSEVGLEYKFDVRDTGVLITSGSKETMVFQTFMSNKAVDDLIKAVQKHRNVR